MNIYPKRHHLLAAILLPIACLFSTHADKNQTSKMYVNLENVEHLNLPEKIRSMIDFEYRKGSFNHIENGSFKVCKPKYKWQIFFYPWWCLTIIYFFALFKSKIQARDLQGINIGLANFLFIFFSILLLSPAYSYYPDALNKDYNLITDKGWLKVSQYSTLLLKSENLLKLAFIKIPEACGIFARIMDKQGVYKDFKPDAFSSELAFQIICRSLANQIKQHRNQEASRVKTVPSIETKKLVG